MDAMRHRQLGTYGSEVSVIGLGFWSIGGAFGHVDVAEARRTIDRALELGVSLFDTAPAYGNSEEFLGEVLSASQRDQLMLTTKCGLARDSHMGRLQTDSRPRELRKQVEASLRRLRCSRIDLLLIHWPDTDVPIVEAVGALDDIRRDGLARYVGVSNFSAVQLRDACSVAPVVCNQVGYHLFDRRWEYAMFGTAQELGVGVVAYSPLANGLLTNSLDLATLPAEDWRTRGDTLSSQRLFAPEHIAHNLQLVSQMADIVAPTGSTMSQAAIAWTLEHPAVVATITGSRRVARLEENLGALRCPLSSEARVQLEALGGQADGLDEDIPVWGK